MPTFRRTLAVIFLAGACAWSCAVALPEKNGAAKHLAQAGLYLDLENSGNLRLAISQCREALATSGAPESTIDEIRGLFFSAAERYYKQGNYVRESVCYLAYIENIDHDNSQAYLRLAQSYVRMGNTTGGLACAKKAYELNPGNKEIINLMRDLDPL